MKTGAYKHYRGNCAWIGVGAIIKKGTLLYSDLKQINDYLTKEMSGGFGYSDVLRPHLNFYDLSADSKNLVAIKESLNQTLANQKPVECKITGIKSFKFGIVFVEIEKNKQLIELHQKILGAISPHKGNCLDSDYEKLIPVLNDDQKESLSKFGNPYMTDFRPHISLGYLPDKKHSLEKVISKIEPMLTVKNFTIDMVDLVKGKTSDKIEVISEYKFL